MMELCIYGLFVDLLMLWLADFGMWVCVYVCVCVCTPQAHLKGNFVVFYVGKLYYAVERHISVLFIDNNDSVICIML